MDPSQAKAEALAITDWRHPYTFDGQPLTLSQERFAEWHRWRWSIDLPILTEALGTFAGKTLLDLACNDGWYGFQAESLGASVVGIDGRDDAIYRANLLKLALERQNISFRRADLEDMTPLGGPFDATLFYGILYHLADPLRVLKRVGQATSRILAVQSFVHASDPEPRLYLFHENTKKPGSALHPLITRPSHRAVLLMLRGAGFDHVYRVSPDGSPTAKDPNWIWSFYYGVKGTPLESLEPIVD